MLFEVEHQFSDPLDCPMALRQDVVQIFDLPHDDRHLTSGIDLIDRRFVGAALVHRDPLWNAVGLHGFVKEAHGCGLVALGGQQETVLPCLSTAR